MRTIAHPLFWALLALLGCTDERASSADPGSTHATDVEGVATPETGSDASPGDAPEPPPPAACGFRRAEDTDPDPKVVSVELEVAAAMWDAGTGQPIHGMAYNGTVPGPLIEANVGDTVRVRVRNRLAEETTIHWHGMRVPNAMDGTPPHTPTIPAGGEFTYEFAARDPGTYWYHPHVHTAEQVERGLQAPLWVRAANEPPVDCEMPLVLDDVLLAADGTIAPTPDGAQDSRLGNHLLANGVVMESRSVSPGAPVVLRLVNAANSRYFDLELSQGPFRVLGSEGGFVAPYDVDHLVLGPGERYVVGFVPTGAPGDTVVLRTRPFPLDAPGSMGGAPDPLGDTEIRALATFTLTGEPQAHVLPAFPVEPVPDWSPDPEPRHTWIVDARMSMAGGTHEMSFTLDGESWPDVPLVTLPKGEIVTLGVRNTGTMMQMHHPFHLHGERFVLVAVNGVPVERRMWKDTFDLPPDAELVFMGEMSNPGTWMLHCHILEHAEGGMMAHYRIGPER